MNNALHDQLVNLSIKHSQINAPKRMISVTYLNVDGSERTYSDDISETAKQAWMLCAIAQNCVKVIRVVESYSHAVMPL